MKLILAFERGGLIGHALALAFGLAGLLLVLPNPEFIAALPVIGQQAFGLSMANGGVVYIVLGALTISLYAKRHLGNGVG